MVTGVCVIHRVHLVLPELKVTTERRESKELEATKDRKNTKEIPETLSKTKTRTSWTSWIQWKWGELEVRETSDDS